MPILIFAQFEIDFFVVAATKGVSSKLLKVGNKRRRTKQEIADQLEAKEREKRASKAKIQQYDVLQAKVKMMEDSKGEGEAALDLLKQFVSTGFVTQDEDGNFTMPGVSGEQKFKPFGDQQDQSKE